MSQSHALNLKQFFLSLLFITTLNDAYATQPTTESSTTQTTSIQSKKTHMWITIGERRFAATLANTDAAKEFATLLPMTLDMEDLNSNEKKFDLSNALTKNTYQPGIIHNGDIMLWGSRTLVVFYKTFDTSYSYTRIGHIEDATELSRELGHSSVVIKFSKD
ncbi:cyclophilin-like fold protein [Marinomonas shanghaiensis]|jgi:hypothetical protein|uniref:cyclophilin-like fold protein n=1 Tax=Marinomonas shanghaiensis TaxID=2202418 RepID=UPI0018E548F4|nr:cyclophilin-like fold protein [Marinomonas shanghaiensis]